MSEVKKYNAYAEGLTVHFELDSEGAWVTAEDFDAQRLRADTADGALQVANRTLAMFADDLQVTALQSTIADMRKLLATRVESSRLDEATDTIARLEARIAELESGRGEPVLYVSRESFDDEGCIGMHATKCLTAVQGMPLFTAPQATVAVLLPERIGYTWPGSADMGWNACLDATAALNGLDK